MMKIGEQVPKKKVVALYVSTFFFFTHFCKRLITQLNFLFVLIFTAVKVTPRSIKHDPNDPNPDCQSKTPLEIPSDSLRPGQKLSVVYTYHVHYHVSIFIYIQIRLITKYLFCKLIEKYLIITA